MGGPMEKSFEEIAKQGEQVPAVPETNEQAIPPAEKKEESNG